MKVNRLVSLLFFLLLGGLAFQSLAQQNEADRKLLAEVRARAEQGDAQSQLELGEAFYFGNLGVAEDEVEAVKWYRKAAEQNLADAQCNLGICYANGQGVAKDEVEAVKWYRKAAEQNLADAQCNLGNCYADGRGVAKDEVQAVKWYRKAAEQNHAQAQHNLGVCYVYGQGVAKDEVEAVKWYRKAAEQNDAAAEYSLGLCYSYGSGVAKDAVEAYKWFRKAAEQNDASAQNSLGWCYAEGQGVAKDEVEALKWYRKAAEQNHAPAQNTLGAHYADGGGVPKDYVEGYKWVILAAGQGHEVAKKNMTILENRMTREQIAEGQKLARNFKPRQVPSAGGDSSSTGIAQTRPESSGTGFFITEDGYLITNEHVAGNGAQVRLVTVAGLISAKAVKVDAANDLALLKAEGQFAALPVVPSRSARLGATVATVGFPNIGLQGFAPKLAKGEIAALSGAQDDPRYFQISVPVQPGNSGGALVDERGNVVGVVSAKLNARAALSASGALPENVNYAVKSSFLLGFLESVPEVSAKLKEPNTKAQKFEEVVKAAEQAAVLVLVY
ncbi:MAG: SEL1-like repeat protein [Chloroflexi bacterium]|nr:SEL1-like repeat protein [Chloroflexota bacterium]